MPLLVKGGSTHRVFPPFAFALFLWVHQHLYGIRNVCLGIEGLFHVVQRELVGYQRPRIHFTACQQVDGAGHVETQSTPEHRNVIGYDKRGIPGNLFLIQADDIHLSAPVHHFQRLVEGGWGAGHLENDVRPFAIGDVCDYRHHIIYGRVHNDICAAFPGQLQPFRPPATGRP